MTRLLDEFGITSDHGAGRAAESFGQTEGDGVYVRHQLGGRAPRCNHRIEQTRAVDVDLQLMSARESTELFDSFHRDDAAAGRVMSVLETNHAGKRIERPPDQQCRSRIAPTDDAAWCRHRTGEQSSEG